MSQNLYLELARLAAPEIILVLTALAVLAIDLVVTRELELGLRTILGSMFATAGAVVAIAWMFAFPIDAQIGPGMLAVDAVTRIVKASILVLTILTLLLNLNTQKGEHVGEHLVLLLLSAVGMLLLVSSRDLLMIFLCLELTTVPLYVLAAFDKHRKESAECGLKFFLFGAISTALTLFGFSLLYGLSGSSSLEGVSRILSGSPTDTLAIPAIALVVAGIGFKVAAAPFHLWAPDVYEAAPLPAATFIASASKVAGFFILGIVMILGLGGTTATGPTVSMGWLTTIGVVAALSMILGNLAALVQQNVRRLLAFSAVAHAGYMLLALLSANQASFAALIFYAVTYALSAIGALTVAGAVQGEDGCRIVDFEGLSQRSPVLSFCMLGFMLSLAGIPPLAGFMGKFFVFATLLGPEPASGWRLGLLLLAVGTSAVSLYYYLQVLKSIYVRPAANPRTPLKVSPGVEILLCVVAGVVLALGCYPEVLLRPLIAAASGSH